MDWSIEIKTEDDVLVATVTGELDEKRYLAMRDRVLLSLGETDARHILVDVRHAVVRISTMGIFALATSNRDAIPRGVKYAVVFSRHTLPAANASFGENVARNRGAQMKSFTDIAEAERWLSEK
ncbi:MAG: STAS/SEC14 domain-containing protein [Dehalococcoidia bacterium]|nr:STAS/SEC14 domain-containing protein [Dehalococcoidia bacterium]